MSAPNITVKFLEPEELDSIRTKISCPSGNPNTTAALPFGQPAPPQPGPRPPDEQPSGREEVPEIVATSPPAAKAATANPGAAGPTAESLKASPAAESPKAEEPYKDNIAHEDTREHNIPPAVGIDSNTTAAKAPPQPRLEEQNANKTHATKAAGKKLLGSAIDHSRLRSEGNSRSNTRASTPVPRHEYNNKVGIGLMVAGIVGLLLTGRS